jgi:hypothetical protein
MSRVSSGSGLAAPTGSDLSGAHESKMRATIRKPRRRVVERTNSWNNNFRGLRIRWERKAEHYGTLVYLACAVITVQAATRQIHRS